MQTAHALDVRHSNELFHLTCHSKVYVKNQPRILLNISISLKTNSVEFICFYNNRCMQVYILKKKTFQCIPPTLKLYVVQFQLPPVDVTPGEGGGSGGMSKRWGHGSSPYHVTYDACDVPTPLWTE